MIHLESILYIHKEKVATLLIIINFVFESRRKVFLSLEEWEDPLL